MCHHIVINDFMSFSRECNYVYHPNNLQRFHQRPLSTTTQLRYTCSGHHSCQCVCECVCVCVCVCEGVRVCPCRFSSHNNNKFNLLQLQQHVSLKRTTNEANMNIHRKKRHHRLITINRRLVCINYNQWQGHHATNHKQYGNQQKKTAQQKHTMLGLKAKQLCQICVSQRKLKVPVLARRPAHLSTSKNVYMNMKHSLTRLSAVIDDYTVTCLVNSELGSNFACDDQQMSQ